MSTAPAPSAPPRDLSPAEAEEWQERSAIIEHDAGESRGVAEACAYAIVIARRRGAAVQLAMRGLM